MRYQKISIETDDFEGETLAGEITTTDDAESKEGQTTIVLFLHDFPYDHSHSHDDLYGALRTQFENKNYQTLMFDFQSCGESGGRDEDFSLETARENLDRVLKWTKRRGFTHYIFVASGAAAALAFEKIDHTTKMLFLFWPVIDLAKHAQHVFYEPDGVTVAAKGKKIGGNLLAQMKAHSPPKAVKTLKIPVLVQYGASDPLAQEQIGLVKTGLNALRIDITSYADGEPGLSDRRHRSMVAHHVGQFLQKYA